MLTEKAAYLKGLMDGLEIDLTTKEGKVLNALKDVIAEICETVDYIDEDVGQLYEYIEEIDDDCNCKCDHDCCCDDDECCDDEDDDDEFPYKVICPTCHDEIELDDLMLEDGSIQCPNCGELLKFDISQDDVEE